MNTVIFEIMINLPTVDDVFYSVKGNDFFIILMVTPDIQVTLLEGTLGVEQDQLEHVSIESLHQAAKIDLVITSDDDIIQINDWAAQKIQEDKEAVIASFANASGVTDS